MAQCRRWKLYAGCRSKEASQLSASFPQAGCGENHLVRENIQSEIVGWRMPWDCSVSDWWKALKARGTVHPPQGPCPPEWTKSVTVPTSGVTLLRTCSLPDLGKCLVSSGFGDVSVTGRSSVPMPCGFWVLPGELGALLLCLIYINDIFTCKKKMASVALTAFITAIHFHNFLSPQTEPLCP